MTFTLPGGERHEHVALPALLDTGAVRRRGPGRPRLRPRRLAGDKGSSSRTVRQRLRQRRIRAVIPAGPPSRANATSTGRPTASATAWSG